MHVRQCGTYGTIRTLIWKPLSELRLIKAIFLLTSANTDHTSASGAKTWFTHLRVKLSDPYNVIDNLRHVTSLRGTTTIFSTWVRILSLWNEVIPNALHIHSQLTKQCFSKTRCKLKGRKAHIKYTYLEAAWPRDESIRPAICCSPGQVYSYHKEPAPTPPLAQN